MHTATWISTAFLFATLALGQQRPSPFGAQDKPQPESAGPGTGACTDRDPFCADLQSAQRAEAEFDGANAQLEGRLRQLPPCSAATANTIHETRDLAFESFAARGEYLKKWRDMAETDAMRFAKLIATRGGLRAELQKSLADQQRDMEDLRTRTAALGKSMEQEGSSSDGPAVQYLRQIEDNKRIRLENLQRTLAKWEGAQRHYDGARRNSEELAGLVAELQNVTESLGGLWKAYFDGLEARASFQCTEVRRPGPQAPVIRRPPE